VLPFSELTRRWFESAFAAETSVQRRGFSAIARGEHALLIAPTGSGKTLAAFLYAIDRLTAHAAEAPAAGVRVLYVSPLKALVYDVERNLRVPLAGIARVAEDRGSAVRLPRVSVRTGDTTTKERREQARNPGEILVTTPESLYLLLGSRAHEHLRSVDTVIVDEVHALAGTKRGAHLALSLERLAALCTRDPQRIGLSATAQPLADVARFLGGDRAVTIVDTSEPPRIDLQISVPVADMTRPDATRIVYTDDAATALAPGDQSGTVEPALGRNASERGMWPAIVPRLLALIRSHRATIVFANSRGLCERLSRRINDLAGEELVRAHHGSLSHAERAQIEDQLKRGAIAGIVATSSLELGIDMGAVDLVLLCESPGSVARGLQRVGRAGHAVGEVSKGRLFPKHRGDLLEAAIVARRMREAAIEALHVPENPLDVLAQQIVAMVAMQDWAVTDLAALVRRSASFRSLPDSALLGVLDMLSGRYPSHRFADLRPRITWDRERNLLQTRRGAALVALINGGTIPDRGTYSVHLGEDGPRLGELDEEMVHESSAGDVFTLGASSFRIERITRDRVIVSPAPGEAGKLPFWHGEGPGRPIELGRALGAFVREISALSDGEAQRVLERDYHLDAVAAQNLRAYLGDQRAATGTLPSDRAITIERFRDELGDYRVCILSPFGARVHAPWALAIEAKLSAHTGVAAQAMYNDDGIVLRFAEGDEPPDPSLLMLDADALEDLLMQQLAGSALFAGMFRENASRALLLPRRRPDARVPLWMQRRRSADLLAVAREFPAFPIILETYRSCLKDVFDVPALRELLAAIDRREVRVDVVDSAAPSPFARDLVFAYVASYLYEGDAPLAERRAHALALDRNLLRELLGESALRDLLDPELIAEVEAELQGVHPERRAHDADMLHDLLRRVGDLREDEIAARTLGDAAAFLSALITAKRASRVRVAGELRVIAVEDAALYRDALGVAPPRGVPAVFLEPLPEPEVALISRFARTHAPFTRAELGRRYALPPERADAVLQQLELRGEIVRGALRPGGSGEELCDAGVLRRIKQRTLQRLRGEVAAVPAAAFARFLPAWHALDAPGEGVLRLQEAIVQLEGTPLPISDLERAILPARVRDFTPAMLDELGAIGWLTWVGHGALGVSDGKIALYRRAQVAALLQPATVDEAALPALQRTLLAHLAQRGACFFVELQRAGGASSDDVLAALQDLIWQGLVTNDTFAPLRAFGAPKSKSPRAHGRAIARASGGRWSLVRDLARGEIAITTRVHARATKLLERYGIVTREVALIEDLPGGFSAIYAVLRAMEEAGKIRRGYFVEGVGGAQFALPGAVDRLRAQANTSELRAVALSAVDPCNPFGWLLPWPGDTPENAPAALKPRRSAGAVIVLVRGEPIFYLGSGGKHLITFPAAREREMLAAAVLALRDVASRRRGKSLRIEQIDGRSARSSELAAELLALRFTAGYRGLELEVQ
jgi:ATP-dependent Lhr-like helicase